MIYRVVHRTRYVYSQAVSHCQSEARLRPRHTPTQRCLSSAMEVDPAPVHVHERDDYFGNRVVYFAVDAPHSILAVTAHSEVEVQPQTPTQASPPWEEVYERLRDSAEPALLDAREYVLESPAVAVSAAIRAYASVSFAPRRPLLDAVADLAGRIHREFTFQPGHTTVGTKVDEVLARRCGVCQDFAHLGIACLRSHGLAARYVSGYLETVPPPGQPRLQGVDASHAWFAVFVPEQGWIDFDPTNDQIPDDRHLTAAWGRDYGDVAPLKGVILGGGAHRVEVSVDVERMPAG